MEERLQKLDEERQILIEIAHKLINIMITKSSLLQDEQQLMAALMTGIDDNLPSFDMDKVMLKTYNQIYLMPKIEEILAYTYITQKEYIQLQCIVQNRDFAKEYSIIKDKHNNIIMCQDVMQILRQQMDDFYSVELGLIINTFKNKGLSADIPTYKELEDRFNFKDLDDTTRDMLILKKLEDIIWYVHLCRTKHIEEKRAETFTQLMERMDAYKEEIEEYDR